MNLEQYQDFVKTTREFRELLNKYNLEPGSIHEVEYTEKEIIVTYRDYCCGDIDDTTVSIPVSEFFKNDTDEKIASYVNKQERRRKILIKWALRKEKRDFHKRIEQEEKKTLARLQAKYGSKL